MVNGGGRGCGFPSGDLEPAVPRPRCGVDGFWILMGTSSGANFHQQQPRDNGRAAPALQLSLSLSLAASSERTLSNSYGGHDSSATESASYQGTWPGVPSKSVGTAVAAAPITAVRKVGKEEIVGNGVSELQVVRNIPSAGRITLREVARDRVDIVAEKMRVMSEELLEKIKSELRSILEGTSGSHYIEEFLYLHKLVQGRVDLTPAMLSMAHHVQLEILVAIKTGIQAFLHPSVNIPQSRLAEVLLYKRCQNIACQSALPAEECRCNICANSNGFCNLCMCVICNKFDFEVNTCRWIGCDFCSHWTHTDCAIRDGQIGTAQTIGEMLFRCQACQRTSELLGWVRDIFQKCASGWDRDALLRELDYVCKIFRLSEDSKGRNMYRKFVELIERLSSSSAESMSPRMLLQALQEMDNTEEMRRDLERILIDTSAEPIELSYAFLESITNEFSVSQVIGRGGFGEVYMGVLQNKKIAVKKLFQTMDFSDKQFQDELTCLKRVKHKNIVRFLGYCSDTKEEPARYNGQMIMAEVRRRFLCFEYVPNKNLRNYLKDESHEHEWDTRCKLIEGICHGLRYLHNNERIIHLDLKPENILLDADMVPKITDFGLSRRFSGEQSRIITKSNARGTLGYIAPEYWSKGEISFKSDIFSLGIIIKELLRGSNDSYDLENWHPSLDIESPKVKRCINIAQLCVDDDPRKRPTIDCIIGMLSEKETAVDKVSQIFGHSRNNSGSSKEQLSARKKARNL